MSDSAGLEAVDAKQPTTDGLGGSPEFETALQAVAFTGRVRHHLQGLAPRALHRGVARFDRVRVLRTDLVYCVSIAVPLVVGAQSAVVTPQVV